MQFDRFNSLPATVTVTLPRRYWQAIDHALRAPFLTPGEVTACDAAQKALAHALADLERLHAPLPLFPGDAHPEP